MTVTTYRDTTGISSESFKLILQTVDRNSLKGKRDYAILLLLWGNALRRSEVTQCLRSDFDPLEQRLWILGKGKKGQRQSVSLGSSTIEAISLWLKAREEVICQKNLDEPLFCAVHQGYWGHRLNTDSIYKLVKKYAALAGIVKPLSPHRLRHSAITAALEITNGDVRSVQKLSRHSNLNTLMIYDDNRRNEQGRVTKLLEELL
jgi:integrase/recombinase XerC